MKSLDEGKYELEHLLVELNKAGYLPLGIFFYDEKLKLLGLAPMENVPEHFVELIGNRISGIRPGDKTTVWTKLGGHGPDTRH